MNNPWIDLASNDPFALGDDQARIVEFNRSADEAHKIHLEILPEPFIGNAGAKVLFLNLNPGYNVRDIDFHVNDRHFIESLRKNLMHANQDYPFYPLDPRNFDSPASRYWRRRLKRLSEKCGLMKVANGVLCVEFFPYHSKKYKGIGSILASQHYSFHLVREAILRKAAIVLMRSEKRWLGNVAELNGYPFLRVRSWQNPTISKKNLPDGFDEIVRLLE